MPLLEWFDTHDGTVVAVATLVLVIQQTATGEEEDGRFHLANMFLGVLEEAHTQHAIERTMSVLVLDARRLGPGRNSR